MNENGMLAVPICHKGNYYSHDMYTAQWIEENNFFFKCSNCECYAQYLPIIKGMFRSPYCPNCGAKMENAEAIK